MTLHFTETICKSTFLPENKYTFWERIQFWERNNTFWVIVLSECSKKGYELLFYETKTVNCKSMSYKSCFK